MADIPAIFTVRLSVRENQVTLEQLHASGITPDSVGKRLQWDARGWVAEVNGRVVAFTIAEPAPPQVWALFVKPVYEGKGIGKALLSTAVQWLWSQGAEEVSLTTDVGTRAARLYEGLGWEQRGLNSVEEAVYVLHRPESIPGNPVSSQAH